MDKVYAKLVNPQDYLEYEKRVVKAVTREDLNNKIQFTSLRVPKMDEDNNLIRYKEELDSYTKKHKLGDIIWPLYKTLFAKNFKDFVDEAKARGLYLFNFWGYVPGSWPGETMWGQYVIPKDVSQYLKEKLGTHFLGFDNGEQDGRYIGGYSPYACPLVDDRKQQYLKFQEHFEELGNDMQNYMSTICSLTFPHYFAKESNTMMLGAESGQALLNTNMWYAYLRGASKQYGLLLVGFTSIWNRWGFKAYGCEGTCSEEGDAIFGPEMGTSLSLLKRIMYSHYMYNCDILGFEVGLLEDLDSDPKNPISPVGKIQAAAVRFTEKHASPGVQHTPVALVMDFFNGWVPPRHLYTGDVYKVWGSMPYNEGDYHIHALFSLLYPGYENSGFFKDERGFLTETPLGDISDVIFSDADESIYSMYSMVILAGSQDIDLELYNKLKGFVLKGGHLVITMKQISNSIDELGKYDEKIKSFFGINDIKVNQSVISSERGKGKISLITLPYGLELKNKAENISIENSEEKEIPQIYDFTEAVKEYLYQSIDSLNLIDIKNRELQYCTNIIDELTLTIAITNNNDEVEDFDILARSGEILRIEELEIEDNLYDIEGYYSPKFNSDYSKKETILTYSIKPKDIRIFKVFLKQKSFELKEKVEFKAISKGKFITLNNISSIKEEILFNPTIRSNFEGLKIDASYLASRDIETLKVEAEYVKRKDIEIIFDFSSMINHYPKLTLLENVKHRYDKSMKLIESTIKKAGLYNCNKIIIATHRNAENNCTKEEQLVMLGDSLRRICRFADGYDIKVYLQNTIYPKMMHGIKDTITFVEDLNIENLKFAFNICHSMRENNVLEEIQIYKDKIDGLLISAPHFDSYNQYYDSHEKVSASKYKKQIVDMYNRVTKESTPDFICLDGTYESWNDIYSDCILFE